jgi:hypothetical protein
MQTCKHANMQTAAGTCDFISHFTLHMHQYYYYYYYYYYSPSKQSRLPCYAVHVAGV